MKKLIALLTLLACFHTHAGIIEVSTNNGVALNESFSVTLTGSGFTSVNALSFLFNFDTSVFDLDESSVLFSNGLALPNDVAEGVNFGFLFLSGPVNDFVITFNLSAIGLGSGDLSVTDIVAGFVDPLNPFAAPIAENAIGGSANVAVSTPATFSLLLLLVTCSLVRRKAR